MDGFGGSSHMPGAFATSCDHSNHLANVLLLTMARCQAPREYSWPRVRDSSVSKAGNGLKTPQLEQVTWLGSATTGLARAWHSGEDARHLDKCASITVR